jgi:hypothetical protein
MCPNHLSTRLSTILVTRSWLSIFLIWLFLILSLLIFPLHFLKYLISAPVILISYLLISSNFLSHRVVFGVNSSINSHFSEVCTPHQILFGWSNQKEWEGWDTWHVWLTGVVHKGFWWGHLRERDHLEDLGADGMITLKWNFKTWDREAWTDFIWL